MIGKRLAVLAGLAASFAANAAPVAADADHPRWKLQPLLHHIAPVVGGWIFQPAGRPARQAVRRSVAGGLQEPQSYEKVDVSCHVRAVRGGG